MAFYGTNPTGGYFKMTPRATVPTFPGTYGPGDKEGTLYFNDGSGTITAGLWVFQGLGSLLLQRIQMLRTNYRTSSSR